MDGPGKLFHSTCSGQASTDVLNGTESPFVQLNSGRFSAFFWILLFKLDAAIRSQKSVFLFYKILKQTENIFKVSPPNLQWKVEIPLQRRKMQ